MDYYNGHYRPLVFVVYIAVKENKHILLACRIKAINGDNPAGEEEETVNATRFKEGSKGLAPADIKEFLNWFLGTNLQMVSSAANISDFLKNLRRKRLAKLHVECEEGPIPVKKSMQLNGESPSNLLSLLQGPRRPLTSCSRPSARPRML
jgi:hypothetical protein